MPHDPTPAKSRLLASVRDTAADLYRLGLIDQHRMLKFDMLTCDFKSAAAARAARDPAFAKALLGEAATLFLSGEPDTARLILRDLVNATVGFEQLAELTHKPSKSLHRMLSPKGNPSMDNLAAIFDAVRVWLKVGFDVRVVEVA